jgi:hypothetical protein
VRIRQGSAAELTANQIMSAPSLDPHILLRTEQLGITLESSTRKCSSEPCSASCNERTAIERTAKKHPKSKNCQRKCNKRPAYTHRYIQLKRCPKYSKRLLFRRKHHCLRRSMDHIVPCADFRIREGSAINEMANVRASHSKCFNIYS